MESKEVLFIVKDSYTEKELIEYSQKLTSRYQDLIKKYNYLKEKGVAVSLYINTLEMLGIFLSDKRNQRGLNDLINHGYENGLVSDLTKAYNILIDKHFHANIIYLLEEKYEFFNKTNPTPIS